MTGSLLADWLNSDVGLSQPVEDLEDDLSDGWLLAELLARKGVLTDFSEYIHKDTPEAKVNNFGRLEQVLKCVRFARVNVL